MNTNKELPATVALPSTRPIAEIYFYGKAVYTLRCGVWSLIKGTALVVGVLLIMLWDLARWSWRRLVSLTKRQRVQGRYPTRFQRLGGILLKMTVWYLGLSVIASIVCALTTSPNS